MRIAHIRMSQKEPTAGKRNQDSRCGVRIVFRWSVPHLLRSAPLCFPFAHLQLKQGLRPSGGGRKVSEGICLDPLLFFFRLTSSQLQNVPPEAIGRCGIPIAASPLTPRRSRTRPSRTWSATTRCCRAGTGSRSTTSLRRCPPPAWR